MNNKPFNREHNDWDCQKCGFINFGCRVKCMKCNWKSKEKTKQLRYNDWLCICGVSNFARRLSCLKCGRRKTNQEKTLTKQNNPRIGDWICTCGEVNFSRRNKCWKCHNFKNEDQIIGKEGDWICYSCKTYNYSFRKECINCSSIRIIKN